MELNERFSNNKAKIILNLLSINLFAIWKSILSGDSWYYFWLVTSLISSFICHVSFHVDYKMHLTQIEGTVRFKFVWVG